MTPSQSLPKLSTESRPPNPGLRLRLHTIIFESDTTSGRTFDIGLLIAIVASIVAVCLESVASFRESHGGLLRGAEWFVTALFTAEYVLRLIAVRYPWRYARSFYGVIDLFTVFPVSSRACPGCGHAPDDEDAVHCKHCGAELGG